MGRASNQYEKYKLKFKKKKCRGITHQILLNYFSWEGLVAAVTAPRSEELPGEWVELTSHKASARSRGHPLH